MPWLPDEQIQAQPWLAIPRIHPVRLIILHSTRGATTLELQYVATKNWLLSPNNNQGIWGSSCNRIISHEGQQCVAWPDNMQPTWSAGYGYNGPPTDWAVDQHAISIELAQPYDHIPFTDACLERTALEVAKLCKQYDIPPVWFDTVDQTGDVPTGITSHDATDNGRRLGKTDVGAMFPLPEFMGRVKELVGEPIDELAALKAQIALLEEIIEASGVHAAAVGEFNLLIGIRNLNDAHKRRGDWLQTAAYHADLLAQALKNAAYA